MRFREFFRLLKLKYQMFFKALLFSFLFSDIAKQKQTQAKTQTAMMTLFQRNLFVPMTSLNQQMVIPTCRRMASRFQFNVL